MHRRNDLSVFPRDEEMLLMIGVVLLVLWLLGFVLMKKVVGGLIHVLLIIAIIAILIHFLGVGGMHIS
jgi:hypothetical protein